MALFAANRSSANRFSHQKKLQDKFTAISRGRVQFVELRIYPCHFPCVGFTLKRNEHLKVVPRC
jgi:hypothetical protein